MAARPAPAPVPVAGGVDVDLPGSGVRLRATRWPGSSPAVVLLHGLASTRHVWDLVVPHLVAGAAAPAVVAVDQRGHGDSEQPAGPYDGATAAADLLVALDALGLSRVVVVGHSWGATTALHLAAASPGRVLALVAVDGGTGVPTGSAADRAELRRRLTPPRLGLPTDELVALLSSGALAPWWSPAVEAALLPTFEVDDEGRARNRLPLEAHLALLDDLLDTDHAALWDRVRCPSWLVACEREGDHAGAARREQGLAAAAAGAARPRVHRWGGALHDVPLQWPALVAGLVQAARDEVAGGGQPVPPDEVRSRPRGEGRTP